MSKIIYVEPSDYFPEEIRKQYKLGEFFVDEKEKRKELAEKYKFLVPDFIELNEIEDYIYLDDMPEGWRIAFGEKMCEEIQNELDSFKERTGIDYEYCILEIKEKYGELRWYDSGDCFAESKEPVVNGIKFTDDIREKYDRDKFTIHRKDNGLADVYEIVDRTHIEDIVNKYCEMSKNICCVCGAPATKMSTDWICPYCDKHAPKNSEDIKK